MRLNFIICQLVRAEAQLSTNATTIAAPNAGRTAGTLIHHLTITTTTTTTSTLERNAGTEQLRPAGASLFHVSTTHVLLLRSPSPTPRKTELTLLARSNLSSLSIAVAVA
uniref:Putative secreted protein n=1 Tax=Anopheles darlingi TaxID=43151 RepID=A0A2M4DG42_ANODA